MKCLKPLRSKRAGIYCPSPPRPTCQKIYGCLRGEHIELTASTGSINDESNYTTKVLWDYALETAACILNMVPTKKTKVLFARKSEFFENDLIDLKASGSVEDLELIQEEDTNPYVDTSLNHEEDDQEIDEPFM
ncbi:hypothetical protein Tco_1265434 [Tanacetum coccineum]